MEFLVVLNIELNHFQIKIILKFFGQSILTWWKVIWAKKCIFIKIVHKNNETNIQQNK